MRPVDSNVKEIVNLLILLHLHNSKWLYLHNTKFSYLADHNWMMAMHHKFVSHIYACTEIETISIKSSTSRTG